MIQTRERILNVPLLLYDLEVILQMKKEYPIRIFL